MLQTLVIKNFALIESQTIEFKKGFNVLVGETGAGKSLILDALGFVLGDKTNKLNLRHGQNKMFVQAIFDFIPNDAKNILNDNGIDFDDSLILTRSYTLDGKNECRINGVVVPTFALKQLSTLLVDTYAQNENIELLKVKNHIGILDGYAESELADLKATLINELNNYKTIQQQISEIGGSKENRERELELLEYQIKDIENANLQLGEDDEIKNQLTILTNYEKIFDNLQSAKQNADYICENLSTLNESIDNASRYDDSLNDIKERVNSSKLELEDIRETINDKISLMEYNPNEIEKLDTRLEAIKLLKRKYGATIQDIFNYLEKIKVDYDNLLFGEEKLEKLSIQLSETRNRLYKISIDLSNARKKIAQSIEKEVMEELKSLGFKNAIFKVDFASMPDIDSAEFTKNGLDNIEFLLSANAGQELKSLAKTISGGEMSRFMLALKNVFAKSFNTSTLVFDEVDTGISGEIGQKVAEQLAVLSKNFQLICITHLCQVTAMADNYVFVKKEVANNETFTKVSYLEGEELIKYIAIVSGAQPTEVALKFARELKSNANQFKQNI